MSPDAAPLATWVDGTQANVHGRAEVVWGYVVTELEPSRSFTWVATGPGVRTTARHLLERYGRLSDLPKRHDLPPDAPTGSRRG